MVVTETPPKDAFLLLFVCAGNRFRSPIAAALAERLTTGLPVAVASSGTLDVTGASALPEAVALGGALGVDLGDHRSRRLTRDQLAGVDLLVGFETIHVRHAVVDAGADPARSFTLEELVELLRELAPPTSGSAIGVAARARVAAAADLRSASERSSLDRGIPDPFGRGRKAYRRTAARIEALVPELVTGLFGPQALTPRADT